MANGPAYDWYLSAWMGSTEMSQADLCRATGYPKAKMSELATGKSRYNRDVVNDLSYALNIKPFELLMHPDEAFALRRLRESAVRIAAESAEPTPPPPASDAAVRKNRKKAS